MKKFKAVMTPEGPCATEMEAQARFDEGWSRTAVMVWVAEAHRFAPHYLAVHLQDRKN